MAVEEELELVIIDCTQLNCNQCTYVQNPGFM
jgi:hypothetical protein